MNSTCHYATLGVGVNASTQEIAAAYSEALNNIRRRLASGNPHSIERLDSLRKAYRTLTCPDQRRAYDEARARSIDIPQVSDSFKATEKNWEISKETSVDFRGSGEEYFRIWLVNTALTILTLGVYSAWAKVRRERYFHRNLVIDGSALDYHGKPRAIFLGRMVVLLFFLMASVAEKLGSEAKLAATILIAFALPWLWVQSIRFRARNSSYRGIRFNFSGTYTKSLSLLLVHGGLCVLTLGLYVPAFMQKQKAFVASNLTYGNLRTQYSAGIGVFYKGLWFPLAIWCSLLVVAVASAVPVIAKAKLTLLWILLLFGKPWIFLFLIGFVIVFSQLVLIPFIRVVGSNLLWNHLAFGQTEFCSTQKVRSYLGIALSNWALTLLTLGFFWPLAQIRMARFRANNFKVKGIGALSNVTATKRPESSAIGSEALAAINLDISI